MANETKYEIPKGTLPAQCKGCHTSIYWIKTKNGKNMPVDKDGTCHFVTCKKADKFRKKMKEYSGCRRYCFATSLGPGAMKVYIEANDLASAWDLLKKEKKRLKIKDELIFTGVEKKKEEDTVQQELF